MSSQGFELKEFRFIKELGPVVAQEESSLFLLSSLLEEFVFDHESDSSWAFAVCLAKRMDEFIHSENLVYIDK